LLGSIFNIEISEDQDIVQANQLKLAHRISVVFLVLFTAITIMYTISGNNSSYFSFLTLLVTIFCIIYLNKTKNYKLVFWVYAVIGNILSATTLYLINGGIHYSDMIWVLVCVWLAYVGLGIKFGLIFLSLNFINLLVFNMTTVNDTIRNLHLQSELDLLAVSIETGCGLLAFGYLTGEFVKMQRYREIQIEQKSQEILTLNSTINANERMVGIGELTMGLAHDLNSPLSSVKFGIQNISDALTDLFTQHLFKITPEEFDQTVIYAKELSSRPVLGGINYLKEERLLKEKLSSSEFNYEESFVGNLLKSGVLSTDEEILFWAINSVNKEGLVKTLKDLVIVFQMIHMVSHAGEQSTEVISGLRNFTNQARKESPEKIDIRENLKMVMHILIGRFKDNIGVELNVPDNMSVNALPRDLFQIWSNILKNSIEAMENNGGGMIQISAIKNQNEISVIIENNGPQIEEHLRDHIFERFKSSKGNSNSGFGLHIVKQILDRNGWNVKVSSDPQRTAFEFTIRDCK